jgi:hypothetical protein
MHLLLGRRFSVTYKGISGIIHNDVDILAFSKVSNY